MRALGPRLAAASVAWLTFAVAAQTVTAPPRPPGFSLVRPVAGIPPKLMHDFGEKEHKYAHPDATRDDSIAAANAPAGPAAGPAGTDTGGKGTGPAREMTDKGASSYFYDKRKK